MCWINVNEQEPIKGGNVDIFVKGIGRECDYEYEGDGVFYDYNRDIIKEVGDKPRELLIGLKSQTILWNNFYCLVDPFFYVFFFSQY